MKQEKGITLVALIITIIVLLILAVVTIQALSGDGIIDKAKLASETYAEGKIVEEIGLIAKDIKIQQAIYGENEEEALRRILTSNDNDAVVTKSGNMYEVIYRGKQFLLGSDLEYTEKIEADLSEWTWNSSTKTLTKYKGDLTTKRRNQDVGELIVPNYYNGQRVEILEHNLISDPTNLVKLKISNGIDKISWSCFDGCSNLKGDLVIPNSITSIRTMGISQL